MTTKFERKKYLRVRRIQIEKNIRFVELYGSKEPLSNLRNKNKNFEDLLKKVRQWFSI